ncbi:MAG: hypothetical protein EPN35_16170 [Rhodanobacter sp.]|nr:MAG: hypothetical protein EPN35_16170 [Rhodanobacter sp.]
MPNWKPGCHPHGFRRSPLAGDAFEAGIRDSGFGIRDSQEHSQEQKHRPPAGSDRCCVESCACKRKRPDVDRAVSFRGATPLPPDQVRGRLFGHLPCKQGRKYWNHPPCG